MCMFCNMLSLTYKSSQYTGRSSHTRPTSWAGLKKQVRSPAVMSSKVLHVIFWQSINWWSLLFMLHVPRHDYSFCHQWKQWPSLRNLDHACKIKIACETDNSASPPLVSILKLRSKIILSNLAFVSKQYFLKMLPSSLKLQRK